MGCGRKSAYKAKCTKQVRLTYIFDILVIENKYIRINLK